MIGGPPGIAQVLEEPDKGLALSFSPQNPAARTILSNNKRVNNVLLRISVPKRTGRKRKRGSNDPFVEDLTVQQSPKDATYLLRSMADNTAVYSVTALTTLQNMHIWRSMPDFAYSTSQTKIVQDVKNKLLSQHYPSIRAFDLPRTYGLQNTEAVPPSVWSTQSIPQTYTYRQNPAVKIMNDPSTGKRVLKNVQAAPKIYSYQVQWDTPEYPKAPMPDIPPLEQQSAIFQQTVAQLRPLFEKRPIWTRRALLNNLDSTLSSFNLVRFCIAYVAFAIRSGPWRDTYCRIGIDPRTDPAYRVYQSIMLQLVPKGKDVVAAQALVATPRKPSLLHNKEVNSPAPEASTIDTEPSKNTPIPKRQTFTRTWIISKDPKSHIFDGVSPIPQDGKVWQLCDMTDTQLAALRDIPELLIRATCDRRYFGWYANGTNAKIRVALKAKVDAIIEGKPLDNSSLDGFMQLPDNVQFEADLNQGTAGPVVAGDVGRIFGSVRTASTTAAGAAGIGLEQLGGDVGQIREESSIDRDANAIRADAPPPTKIKLGAGLKEWLGENPTRQQLEWGALYRAFARTEPGKVPAYGGGGKGRLSRSKPVVRKSYRPREQQNNSEEQIEGQGGDTTRDTGARQIGSNHATATATVDQGAVPSDPIDVDMDMDTNEYDGPEVQEGEDIIPSIEDYAFGEEDEGELDLDLDIKMEEDEIGAADADQMLEEI